MKVLAAAIYYAALFAAGFLLAFNRATIRERVLAQRLSSSSSAPSPPSPSSSPSPGAPTGGGRPRAARSEADLGDGEAHRRRPREPPLAAPSEGAEVGDGADGQSMEWGYDDGWIMEDDEFSGDVLLDDRYFRKGGRKKRPMTYTRSRE